MINKNKISYLSLGNNYFREGNFIKALENYEKALGFLNTPKHLIEFNYQYAVKKIKKVGNTPSYSSLQPLNDLKADATKNNYWESTGQDPHLEIIFKEPNFLKDGWYKISILISGQQNINLAKFYIDYGSDYSEAHVYQIPYSDNQFISRVIKIKSGAKKLRFDPTEKNTSFFIHILEINHISEDIAFEEMLIKNSKYDFQISNDSSINLTKNKLLEEFDKHSREEIEKEYSSCFQLFHGGISYKEWINKIELPSIPSTKNLLDIIRSFDYKPLISIIMPTYNTEEKFLRACIDSVLNQSYSNWELCIADDASPKSHVKKILNEYKEIDSRIKVTFRSQNGHISLCSNDALKLAKGEFVALLDHDDLLAQHALFFIIEALNINKNLSIIYSDEDKVDEIGVRSEPHFKSDWNKDLFYSQNYVSHLGVHRLSLINNIGGFRVGVEGSQDHDLLLRCLNYINEEQIYHIPRILYHWRTVQGSTALASSGKNYTTRAGIKALKDYFSLKRVNVQVGEGLIPNSYHVKWPVPPTEPLVSLLIPTRDKKDLIEVCVRSILEKTTYKNFEILILDNESVELETKRFFDKIKKEDNRIRILPFNQPFNYSAINNFGATHAQGEIIGLINNDIEVISDNWLSEMVSLAIRKDIGCVGAKLYFSNDTIQHAGVIIGIGGVAGHSHKYFPRDYDGYFGRLKLIQNLSAVTAACLIVRKEVFNQANGLDEKNLTVAFNDVDFCLKVRSLGYKNIWTPYAELYHYESISRGSEDSPEKAKRFAEEVNFMKDKWSESLNRDPFYNRNLSMEKEDFSIRSI